MQKRSSLIVAVSLAGIAAAGALEAQQARPVNTTAPVPVEEVVTALRSDLQANRADVMAKNITLTSEQAARFWPLFEKYQQEQNVIMDAQLAGLKQYAENAEKLDDASALALIKAHLERDERMVALRQRWLGEFQKVLPTKLAVRVIQIDRRLSLVHQMQFSALIPLVH